MKGIPSNTRSLKLLEEQLRSNELLDSCMQLSSLDGFLTGIACSPEPIPPAEWWKLVWQGTGEQHCPLPAKTAELVLDRYDRIVANLNREPSFIEPVFSHEEEGLSAVDWCEGFTDAYVLRMDRWVDLIKTPGGQELLFPIFVHLFDDDGRSIMDIPADQIPDTLATAIRHIPMVVPSIFAFWESKRIMVN